MVLYTFCGNNRLETREAKSLEAKFKVALAVRCLWHLHDPEDRHPLKCGPSDASLAALCSGFREQVQGRRQLVTISTLLPVGL